MVLGGMPVLRLIKPEIGRRSSTRPTRCSSWRSGTAPTGYALTLVGWVVVTTVVGTIVTRRRAVQ